MFVTRCARAAAGARGPDNVHPARHSNVALSVWSTVISIKGETVVMFVRSYQWKGADSVRSQTVACVSSSVVWSKVLHGWI